ncbi:DUF1064 domain-containing protein [Domibacillus enclensis]|uniref:DUF1064 domain-containing protein n=1 Tax=Domibacillus enclensis TaxID=1017273 RepID=A0A1N6WH51_9BACI|nr:DUF1064 domain-containing protein [Domibacillus enclensis]OXS77931.1 hypothetical protein B1B05_10015 [Domibacillus enclensis]SIQ89385.1 Protein of unknown function [Domibacillus enclensis]
MRKARSQRNWNAKKTFAFGKVFDSKAEADYYKLLLADPNVEKVDVQPAFDIIPAYTVTCRRCEGSGRRISEKTKRAINCTLCSGKGSKEKAGAKYTADFKVYWKDGRTEIVDVKGGPASRDFSLRRKLLEQAIGQELVVMEYTKAGWRRKR